MKTWSEIKAERLSPQRIAASRARAEAKVVKMNLEQLRKGLGLTQREITDAVETTQSELSRVERRDDHLLSTLRGYVAALGGDVEIFAVVDGRRVRLVGV
jgi:predicted XRE-type DNA-binding protein